MRRRLWNIAAGVSLVLMVAALALELTGGFVDSPGRTRHLFGRWSYHLDGSQRPNGSRLVVQLVVFHSWQTPIIGPVIPMGSSPTWTAWQRRFPKYVFWISGSFGFEYAPTVGTNAARNAIADGIRLWAMMPYWAIQALLLIIPIIAWLKRRRRIRTNEFGKIPCDNCGYDLRATPERCPECGTEIGAGIAARNSVPYDATLRR